MAYVDESPAIRELSPGKCLIQGRLQAGLTQEQVAKELYMTLSKVKALESDDYGRLISDTFARGYIRAYANLVKIDVNIVLAAYDRLMETVGSDEREIPPQVATSESSYKGAWQFLVLMAAFFVGLWLISVWFFDNHVESQAESKYLVPDGSLILPLSGQQVSVVSSVAASSSNVSAAMSTASALPSATVVVGESAVLSQTNSASSIATSSSVAAVAMSVASSIKPVVGAGVAASQASSVTVSAVATSSVNNGSFSSVAVKKTTLDEVSFSFTAESWLEVSDSRGDVLATELQAAGSQLKLVGLAPFDVKLGNAPAASVYLNGKKIEVIPLMGSNVLILKVGN